MNGNTHMFKQERVSFFNGQCLTAGDLTAAQDVNRMMRWLHNSSLHNWGIGVGLAVTGAKGAREVIVAQGYALDVLGREIILAESKTLPVPPLAGENGKPTERDLTISYPMDEEVEEAETRAGICLPRGAVRLSEAPVIRWLEPREVRNSLDIMLARASIMNCQLDAPLSTTQRRDARPTQQPYIAAGQTARGQTDWEKWEEQDQAGTKVVLGFQTVVDTSTARFRITPNYIARIKGSRLITGMTGNLPNNFLVDGFTNIVGARPNTFTLRILMPVDLMVGSSTGSQLKLNPGQFLARTQAPNKLQERWNVVWIGVEG